jgi:hypothetical protein
MSPDGRMMAVDVELGSQFHAGVPKPLFEVPGYDISGGGGAGRYSVTRDGQRFLFPLSMRSRRSYEHSHTRIVGEPDS